MCVCIPVNINIYYQLIRQVTETDRWVIFFIKENSTKELNIKTHLNTLFHYLFPHL